MLNPVSEKYQKLLRRICETSTKSPLSGRKSADHIPLWEFCKEKDGLSDEFENNLKISGTAYNSVNKIGSERGISKSEVILKLIKATCLTRDWTGLDQFIENYAIATSDRKIDAFEGFEELVKDIRDKAKKERSKDEKNDNLSNPYKGIHHFTEDDSAYFFGRDQEISDLYEKIEKQPFIAVIGASGIGKSSLIHAGIIPKVEKDENRMFELFRFDTTDKNPNPFQDLATAITSLLHPNKENIDKVRIATKLSTDLENGDSKLGICFREIYKVNKNKKILLIIDQFEDIFSPEIDEDIRFKFFDILEQIIPLPTGEQTQQPKVTLLISLRRDFVDHIQDHYSNFFALIKAYREDIGSVSDDGLRQIIVEPAKLHNVKVEEKLVDAIVKDREKEKSSIFLIENALTTLWENRTDDTITHMSYLEIGGIYGALDKQVDEDFKALNENEKKLAEIIFVKMVRPGKDGSPTVKKRVKRNGFSDEEWSVVKKITGQHHRLIIIDEHDKEGTTDKEETAELAHDKLITEWDRLKIWLKNHQQFLIFRDKLESAMQISEKGNDNLIEGVFLEESVKLKDDQRLTLEQKKFIESSLGKDRRDKGIKKIALISSLVALIGFIALSVLLHTSNKNLENQKLLANNEKNKAKTSLIKLAAYTAKTLEEENKNNEAALLAFKIIDEDNNEESPSYKQAISVLKSLSGKIFPYRHIHVHKDNKEKSFLDKLRIGSFDLFPDAKKIAIDDGVSDVIVFDIEKNSIVERFKRKVFGYIRVSPDEKIHSFFLDDEAFKVVDIKTGDLVLKSDFFCDYDLESYGFDSYGKSIILWCSDRRGFIEVWKFDENIKKYKISFKIDINDTPYFLNIKEGVLIYSDGISLLRKNIYPPYDEKKWGLNGWILVKISKDEKYYLLKNPKGDWAVGTLKKSNRVVDVVKLILDEEVSELNLIGSHGGSFTFDKHGFYFEDGILNFYNDWGHIFIQFDLSSGAEIYKGKVRGVDDEFFFEFPDHGFIEFQNDALVEHDFLYMPIEDTYMEAGFYKESFDIEKNIFSIVDKDSEGVKIYKKVSFPEEYNSFHSSYADVHKVYLDKQFQKMAILYEKNHIEVVDIDNNKLINSFYFRKDIADIDLKGDATELLVSFRSGDLLKVGVESGQYKKIYNNDAGILDVFYSDEEDAALVKVVHFPYDRYRELDLNTLKIKNTYFFSRQDLLFFDNDEVNISEKSKAFLKYENSIIYDKFYQEIYSINKNHSGCLSKYFFVNKKNYNIQLCYNDTLSEKEKCCFIVVNKDGGNNYKITLDFKVKNIVFSDNGKYFVAVGDEVSSVFNVSEGKLVSDLYHEEGVVYAEFTEDSKVLIFHQGKKVLKAYEVESGSLVFEHSTHNNSLTFLGTSSDSKSIAWLDGSRKIIISPLAKLENQSIAEHFKSLNFLPVEKGEVDDVLYDFLYGSDQ